MAMTIFFVLNGLGVVFLLFVLANFWKEGRRAGSEARKNAPEYGRRDRADVLVVTHPISVPAHGGLNVMQFRARARNSDKLTFRASSGGTPEVPVRRFSTK